MTPQSIAVIDGGPDGAPGVGPDADPAADGADADPAADAGAAADGATEGAAADGLADASPVEAAPDGPAADPADTGIGELPALVHPAAMARAATEDTTMSGKRGITREEPPDRPPGAVHPS